MTLKAIFYLIICSCMLTLPAFSAVYHIDPNAGANGNGTASSPFKQWSQLPNMKTGDDVYFKCGTKYSPSHHLTLSWEGTEANPAVIGAYYIKDGKAVYGVNGARPILSGSNYTVPTPNSYLALITVYCKDYVHIQDLHIYQSGDQGVKFTGDHKTGANAAHFILRNVKIEGTNKEGIVVTYNPKNYGLIENCDVSGAAYQWYTGTSETGTWPVTVSIVHCAYSNLTIRGNYVHENWGEGIGVWGNRYLDAGESGYATVEDNIVWNNRRVDIYLESSNHNIVRRNLCVGVNDSKFASAVSDGRSWNQFGIWINSEKYRGIESPPAKNNKIYNNFSVGHYSGMGIASEAEGGTITGNVFYNNTVIANRYNWKVSKTLMNFEMSDNEIKNNVSYCPPDTVCKDVSSDPSWLKNKITTDYNAWTSKPKYWGGPNDKLTNDAWSKIKGWQNLKDIPSLKDFMPLKGNPVIDGANSLSNPYNKAISLCKSMYQISPLKIIVETTERTSDGLWDIGALPFQLENRLAPPVLRIKDN